MMGPKPFCRKQARISSSPVRRAAGGTPRAWIMQLWTQSWVVHWGGLGWQTVLWAAGGLCKW